ncbi:large ribosomal subunit protein mL64 [Latimeria chalumnae]|uniref:Large ribosomal subunit protein mL64 n=1 Tax=Latimeria chalumnae TaxID=7897 RepID=H3B6E1_LATCH|nr:PREDICTED: growth arrest and DNA damage-inducible proteins-interacting protein 1 [Latimeria chalumnae]|eukprot:XP_005994205.1 PREDICTED: growth arrest and DNA damage-inducible proteins-interacting protein 1 [Latimeria chalumnae]
MAAPRFPRLLGLFGPLLAHRRPAGAPVLWGSCCQLQAAAYNPKPLPLNVSGFYLPDKKSETTPKWQKTPQYDAKLFGRYGEASRVDPALLWPDPEQLQEMEAEEREWFPSLQEMQKNITAQEKELKKKQLAREKLIAANMAKMPQMVEKWRREKRELKRKQREDKAKRDRLVAEARERFGYSIDPRSPKFQEMVKDLEKEEKKKQKLLRKLVKEEEMKAADSVKAQAVPPSA